MIEKIEITQRFNFKRLNRHYECFTIDFINHNEKLKILGFVIFYLLYFIEWLIKLIISAFTLGKVKAYCSISFEQEAYNNEWNYEYQKSRKRFSWLKYIFKLVK